MCGRYGLYDITDDEILKENTGYTFRPNYNVAPTQSMPIIIQGHSHMSVRIMQWGIKRKLGPDVMKSIFNTRSEKALERFWGKTVRSHRCLVPANGFYEWHKSGSVKIPFWIHAKEASLIYFAGIYDADAEGNPHYSIMTTSPNAEMSQLHDRMPVILGAKARNIWLAPDIEDDAILSDIMCPLPDGQLDVYEVSKDVNTARSNTGQLIEPLNSQ